MLNNRKFLVFSFVVFFLIGLGFFGFMSMRLYFESLEGLLRISGETEKFVLSEKPLNNGSSRYINQISRSYTRIRTETFEITAYTLEDCDKPKNHPLYGISASGKILSSKDSYKVVAVDNHKIKFGTRMIIHHPSGPIHVIAVDTGGDIIDNRLDLFISNRKEAMKWGRKFLKVDIIE